MAMSGGYFVVIAGEDVGTGVQWGEVREATEYLTTHIKLHCLFSF